MDRANDPMADEREQRLECAIAEYLNVCENGTPPCSDDPIAAYPDLADELRQFITDHDRILQLAHSSQRLPGQAIPPDAPTRVLSAVSTPANDAILSFSQF